MFLQLSVQFEKPGRREDFDYPDMAKEAGMKALADSGCSYKDVEQVVCGYCYGDTTCGQRAVYQLGLTGVPVYNVSGPTYLFVLAQYELKLLHLFNFFLLLLIYQQKGE